MAALKEKGIPPEAFTLNAYAAVEVLKAGIEKAGKDAKADAVAKALKAGLEVKTAIGTLTYGKTGDLSSPSFSMYKWGSRQDRRRPTDERASRGKGRGLRRAAGPFRICSVIPGHRAAKGPES